MSEVEGYIAMQEAVERKHAEEILEKENELEAVRIEINRLKGHLQNNKAIFKKIFGDEHGWPLALAKSRGTPAYVLGLLAGNDDWSVREAVAANNQTSRHILKKLAKDTDSDVQSAARRKLQHISANGHKPRR